MGVWTYNSDMKYKVIKETEDYVDCSFTFEDPNRGPRTVRFFIDQDMMIDNILVVEHGRTFGLMDYFSDEEINYLWTIQV